MPHLQIDDARLFYRTDGNPDKPCLVLSNSLGTHLGMWDAQAEALSDDYFVLRYDTRGHGRSECGTAPVTFSRLARDVVGLLDALAIWRAHFCGISMGGLTGQQLALTQPQRLGKLVLANTAARIGQPEAWAARAAQVRRDGMDAVADGAAARWFSAEFIEREPRTVARLVARLRELEPERYAACCDALAATDLRGDVGSIALPLLIIAGERDPVTTIADAEWLAGAIAGARMTVVPASHISNVEAEQAFTAALREFLSA